MGNATSAQPTDYQVESSERITLYDATFDRPDGDIEHSLPHQNGPFYRHIITFTFSVNNESEFLKGVFTREQIYENVVVGQLFPVKRSSDLRTGIFEEIGLFNPGTFRHSIELFIPKNLGERRICGFILDSDNVVVAKARGVIAYENEFQLNDSLESRIPFERTSRTEGIFRYSKLEEQKQIQNALTGLSDALKTLSSFKKSRVEFIEASDTVKLAYRAYFPSSHKHPSAIFIIVAGNSHFHDIIAHGLTENYPISAYILELRGYGYSGGPRGSAPFKEQVWMDIKTFIKYVKMNSPGIPIFLAGHYYHGGLILNYSSWKERDPVDGYAFISPNFGSTAVETTNKEKIAQMITQEPRGTVKSIDTYSFSELAASLFGRGHEQQHFLTAFEQELNPMIVDFASAGISKACSSISPRKQFETIDKPFSVWLGENEEFLIPEKLVQYPRRAKVYSSINVLPGLTHMGVINTVSKHIGDWMMTMDLVKKVHMDESAKDIQEISNYSSDDFKHSTLRDLDVIANCYAKLGLQRGKFNYLIANDGCQIRYQVFLPQQKPSANIVFVQSDIKVVLAWLLANKCNVVVYAMDLRGIDNASTVSKDSLLSDVRTLVRNLKCNEPEMPLLLAGHGYGASVALNYSAWKQNEPVNGYILVSPIIDYHSPFMRDLSVINNENMNRIFSANEEKNWFLALKRSYSYSSGISTLPNLRKSTSTTCSDETEISLVLWDAIACRNIAGLLRDIQVPFGLWIGSEDELVKARELIDLALKSSAKVPLKEIDLVLHSSHYGNLITSSAYIVPFIKRFTKIVAPSLIFKIRDPSLENFEKIQFIGRGSFGRVYLVKHKISEKYFAMKILSKKEILEAKEVNHVLSERNILRDLNSSFAVSFVGSFQDRNNLYILMDYIIGGELFTQLTLRKRFGNETAKFYAAEVILFFEDIHSRNIIFRDLKPENILIDAMGHIKMTDFGFAKYLRGGRTFTFCGTPQYIAPEIIINAELGKRSKGYGISSDYYSLGILIYEMLVGQTPFHDQNVRAIYRKILYATVEYPWGIDPAAKDLIRSLLIRSVSKRLGCSQGQSIEDIKRHKWFQGIDWEQLRRREISPPFVPKFSHAGDTSNFIPWSKDKEVHENLDTDYDDVFKNF